MPEFISTSKLRSAILLVLLALVYGSSLSSAFGNEHGGEEPATSKQESKSTKSEDDDFSSTPLSEYGEFNETNDEEADTKFFQYGRFFGVSLGVGFEFLDGYRGALWQGGFPVVDFKLHYWFDFNLAIDMGFYTVMHRYSTTAQGRGQVDVNLTRVGIDVKYYVDTRNLSAPISFASPFFLIGAGAVAKTESIVAQGNTDQDNGLGLSLGAGLEFVMNPRKTYLEIEGKMHIIPLKDTYTTNFTSVNLPNLTGNFYTLTMNILFTW